MNSLTIYGPSTTVLGDVLGYNAGDQYLTQIGTFVINCDTSDGVINLILPSVASFRLGSGNFQIYDVGNAAGSNNINVSFADSALVNGNSSLVLNVNSQSVTIQLSDGAWYTPNSSSGGGGGATLKSGRFSIVGTGQVYNLNTLFGVTVESVKQVTYDTATLPYDGGANWSFATPNLTFGIGVSNGIEVNVLYT